MTKEYRRVLAAAEAGTDVDEELPPFPAPLLLATLDAAVQVTACPRYSGAGSLKNEGALLRAS